MNSTTDPRLSHRSLPGPPGVVQRWGATAVYAACLTFFADVSIAILRELTFSFCFFLRGRDTLSLERLFLALFIAVRKRTHSALTSK